LLSVALVLNLRWTDVIRYDYSLVSGLSSTPKRGDKISLLILLRKELSFIKNPLKIRF